MLPILQIGPLAIQTPGLFLLLGIWLGLNLAERLAPNFKVDANIIYNLVFFTLIAGILGARLGYALQSWEAFKTSPLSLISLNPGLLDPVSGLASGLVAAIIYGNRKSLSLWPTLDSLTPLFAVFAIGVALSNFASGNAFGMETKLPWGIDLWSAKRHPTQIYNALIAIFILWKIYPKGKEGDPDHKLRGTTFLEFLSLSAGARLFIEAFRGDSTLFLGLRSAQVLAWVILAISMWKLSSLDSEAANG